MAVEEQGILALGRALVPNAREVLPVIVLLKLHPGRDAHFAASMNIERQTIGARDFEPLSPLDLQSVWPPNAVFGQTKRAVHCGEGISVGAFAG